MSYPNLDVARDLCAFIDAAPSPHHACREAARRLDAVGFGELTEVDAWEPRPGGRYVVRGGSLIAWYEPPDAGPTAPFRLLGAHTDSPNLRIKPQPDSGRAGYRQLGVEVYGGVLLNSWLDRDLGISGRVFLSDGDAPEAQLFRVDDPVLRVPQLAIHLNREIHTDGLKLNAQTHMTPVFGTGTPREGAFREFLADRLDVPAREIKSWEVMTHDLTPSLLIGPEEELLSAPRLDNLCSTWACVEALTRLAQLGADLSATPVISLFDHEEVGSGSRSGAQGPFLRTLLERVVLLRGGTREDYHRALAASACVSSDMAHATHPNYMDKHDETHRVFMNQGPVIKLNANLRYASEGATEARFQVACEAADVPFQKWVMRSDLACGSTIGPLTAQNLGMPTVDVGNPQLAMHSARELAGSHDPDFLLGALVAFCK
jgi:aspartyl aminopeptidase